MCHYVFHCLFDDPSSWLPFLIGCLPTCAWIYLLLSCIDLKQIGLVGPEDDIASIATLKMSPMFTLLNMHVHLYTPMNQPWWRNLLFSLKHGIWIIVKVRKSREAIATRSLALSQSMGDPWHQFLNKPKCIKGLRMPIQNHPDALEQRMLFSHKQISGSPFWWKCASINQPVGRLEKLRPPLPQRG